MKVLEDGKCSSSSSGSKLPEIVCKQRYGRRRDLGMAWKHLVLGVEYLRCLHCAALHVRIRNVTGFFAACLQRSAYIFLNRLTRPCCLLQMFALLYMLGTSHSEGVTDNGKPRPAIQSCDTDCSWMPRPVKETSFEKSLFASDKVGFRAVWCLVSCKRRNRASG